MVVGVGFVAEQRRRRRGGGGRGRGLKGMKERELGIIIAICRARVAGEWFGFDCRAA